MTKETPLWKCWNEYFIWKQNQQSLHKKSPSLLNKLSRNSFSGSTFLFWRICELFFKNKHTKLQIVPLFQPSETQARLSPSCTGVYFNPPKKLPKTFTTHPNLERFQINCASSLSFSMSLWNSAEPSCNISVFLGQVGMLQNDLILRQLQTDW